MKPLVTNKDMTFTTHWELQGMEVDLLSVLIFDKKKVITASDIQYYMQGIFEKLVAHSIKHTSQAEIEKVSVNAHRDLSKYTPEQLASYRRGWANAGSILEKSKNDRNSGT